jgi:hypothetical protein
MGAAKESLFEFTIRYERSTVISALPGQEDEVIITYMLVFVS